MWEWSIMLSTWKWSVMFLAIGVVVLVVALILKKRA